MPPPNCGPEPSRPEFGMGHPPMVSGAGGILPAMPRGRGLAPEHDAFSGAAAPSTHFSRVSGWEPGRPELRIRQIKREIHRPEGKVRVTSRHTGPKKGVASGGITFLTIGAPGLFATVRTTSAGDSTQGAIPARNLRVPAPNGKSP